MKKIFSRQNKTIDAPPHRRSRPSQTLDVDDGSQQTAQPTYRRNRTITGSLSANVASSNELNADLRSPRAHVHHLSQLRRRLFSHFLVVLVAGALLYVLISQLIASLVVAPNSGATLTIERRKEYASYLMSYFDRHPLERSLFSVNTEGLLSFVADKYPEVSAIHLDSSGILGRVTAYVSVRKPIARWSLRGENQFVDQQGTVFSYNAYESPALQIIDSSGTATASGLVTSNRFLAFVGRVVGAAKLQGYNVTEASIPPLTTRQLEIKVDGAPYRIKYTIDRSAGEQAEDMGRMIKYLQTKGITPSYIDVRTGGRAVYR